MDRGGSRSLVRPAVLVIAVLFAFSLVAGVAGSTGTEAAPMMTFNAVGIEPAEGQLDVDVAAIKHPDPKIERTGVPRALLPTSSIIEFDIRAVADSVDRKTGEWTVGGVPFFAYATAFTRFDDAPRVGDLVRVTAVRTQESGPLVAERIRVRDRGPMMGPAATELEITALFRGAVESISPTEWVVGGLHFAINAGLEPTEIEPGVAVGDVVVVAFEMPEG